MGELKGESRKYEHLHRCRCGAVRKCQAGECIGDGGCPPPEGYYEECLKCRARSAKQDSTY